MTTKRNIFAVMAALATGVIVYAGLTLLQLLLVLNVFAISINVSNDRILLPILELVPLICALLAAVLVDRRLRSKRQTRGFEVILEDREEPRAGSNRTGG